MQYSTTSVHRGAFILAGVAAIALCYYSWSRYPRIPQAQSTAKLHRSNAIHGHRSQRQQRTPQPSPPNQDPFAAAMQHLAEAEDSGHGFGIFNDRDFVTAEMLERHGEEFTLLPSRLDGICDTVMSERQLSIEEREELSNRISTAFLACFIKECFPRGYYIAGVVEALQQELAHTIAPDLLTRFMDTNYPPGSGYVGLSSREMSEVAEPLPTAELMAQTLAGEELGRNSQSHARSGEGVDQAEGQQVVGLLYRIAEEQAKRSGYQHQGVKCNGCSMQPITGIRFRCANCGDYDLCEMCEAQQIHIKTHIFYKIRIPAPTRGQIKLVQPKWYPGDPSACPESIPSKLMEHLTQSMGIERSELDAFYDQFKCIAGKAIVDDTDGIGMAIDRQGFDQYFTPTTADRAPSPNLIYDRIFAFYDANGDDLISFAEYAKGMFELAYNKSREARIQRLFRAFDINRDGFVERRDFLHLLQAHYNLSKDVTHEMLFSRWDGLTDDEIQEVIRGNNPISAAFGGSSFAGHLSRHREGKHMDAYGDLVYDDDNRGILKEDSQMLGNRAEAIARQASDTWPLSHARQFASEQRLVDEPVMTGYVDPASFALLRGSDSTPGQNEEGRVVEDVDRLGQIPDDRWPDSDLEEQDVRVALGRELPVDEIMDPVDRRRVLHAYQERRMYDAELQNSETERTAVADRWQRRQFYLDEEQGFRPPAAYHESDSSDDDSIDGVAINESAGFSKGTRSRQRSVRSRSSSKVRFDDNTMHSELETKSEVSSRNTPLNERWGGVEFSQANRDTGVEIIYEAVQEAFNDMLNHFFKEEEDKCMAARATRIERINYKTELDAYERDLRLAAEKKERRLIEADMERTNALLNLLQNGSTEAATRHSKSPPSSPDVGVADNAGHASSDENRRTDAPDPMLPQNRPDEDATCSTNSPRELCPGPDELHVWHEHNLIDRQADARRGYGRLNIDEFKRKLQATDMNDIDIGAESDGERGYWEAKADLGKWNFLSSWIEMGSF